jgi:hypothetical protein
MKKVTIVAFICSIFPVGVHAQTTFQKVYGGTAMDNGNSVRKTSDNGYIIVGTTTSFGSGGQDVLVIKINQYGDTTWTKTYGGTDNEYGFCVQQTTDGGYIVSGYTTSFADVAGDMYLIKLNVAGDTTWTRTYGGNGYEWGAFVQQTTDGGYIVAGQTPAYGAGGFDAYFIKLNAAGDISWTKTYGGSGLEIGSAVQQTSDGGYILSGQIDTYGAGFGDFYLVKTDASGNVVWTKAYGNDTEEAGVTVKQTTDGGFIIGGTSESTVSLGKDMCLIKTNSTGDTLWAKTYGGPFTDECFEVIQTTDGGYMMCGHSFSFSTAGDYDVYIVKTDSQGIEQWSKTYGASVDGTNNESGFSIQQTNDGGYVIIGETFSFGLGLKNVYLIKTDALGNSGCNQNVPATITTNLLPQVIAPPTLTSSGGTIFYPATMINSGGTPQSILCEFRDVPLPITLQNFRVLKANKTTAELLWQTAIELNNRGFDIQRSFDGNNFTPVNFVPGAGNSDNIKYYRITDVPGRTGSVYYRLKQIDLDGNSKLSVIVSVLFNKSEIIGIYPNPAQQQVTVEGIDNFSSVQVFDVTGKLMRDIKTHNQYQANINLIGLVNGVYLLRLANDKETQIIKLIISK